MESLVKRGFCRNAEDFGLAYIAIAAIGLWLVLDLLESIFPFHLPELEEV